MSETEKLRKYSRHVNKTRLVGILLKQVDYLDKKNGVNQYLLIKLFEVMEMYFGIFFVRLLSKKEDISDLSVLM